ncbi:MAG TPA: sulfite oxidase [Chloroflexota bacterium]|jgi:DMSO/TMAO reductase YedYZ molybdopterin-dependent catalytic subunit|nr:sulfite oxidase [Chloroflexota bacterium]
MSDTYSSVVDSANLIILAEQPLVAETPLALQEEQLTPNPRFFIRNHFGIPTLDARAWRLAIGGTVNQPRSLSLADLHQLPARRIEATVECAGNGRSFFPPPTEGNQFGYGAVSTASWTGVSLVDVLGPNPFKPGTVEVLFTGADHGFEKNVGAEISFQRSLPVDVALHPDTILAYEMNGEPLPIDHGFPVRLLVPSWYGVASVKWLLEIRALDQPFQGYFQVQRYIYPSDHGPIPLRERRVRAVITQPTPGEVVKMGPVKVRGVAWSGNQPITKVELSTDGGATWYSVDLEPSESPYAWQRWQTVWQATEPGSHTLKVRATDASGAVQPEIAAWNLLGYGNNGIQSLAVEVRAS